MITILTSFAVVPEPLYNLGQFLFGLIYFLTGGGDVKYHQGYSSDVTTSTGQQVHLTLAANPSHLEFVSSVVMGRCRAKQRLGLIGLQGTRRQLLQQGCQSWAGTLEFELGAGSFVEGRGCKERPGRVDTVDQQGEGGAEQLT